MINTNLLALVRGARRRGQFVALFLAGAEALFGGGFSKRDKTRPAAHGQQRGGGVRVAAAD